MLDKLFLQILNMSFTASFVIAFVLLIRLLLKKTPKIFSYALWSVVLFRLICPFSFESVFSVLPSKANPVPTNIGFMQAPQIDTGIPIINDSINPILPEATPVASINPLQIWMFLGEILWLSGIVALLIYSLVTLYKLIKKLKGARCLNDNIYMSDNISTAFVLGVVRPKIYLPLSLNNKEQDYILLHEQTHIKRLDHIVKILAFLVLCVHWFNPLVWVASFAFSKDMEQACDEAVIKTLGNEVKKDYSASLLSLATGKRIVGGTPLAFGEGDTKGRVKNVLNYKKPAFWVIVVSVIAVALSVFCLVSNPQSKEPPTLYAYSENGVIPLNLGTYSWNGVEADSISYTEMEYKNAISYNENKGHHNANIFFSTSDTPSDFNTDNAKGTKDFKIVEMKRFVGGKEEVLDEFGGNIIEVGLEQDTSYLYVFKVQFGENHAYYSVKINNNVEENSEPFISKVDNGAISTTTANKELTKETAAEFILQTLRTFKLNSDNTISFTLPAVIPTDENGKTKLFISSSATFSPEPGTSSVQEILDWNDDWQGGESYAAKLDTSKGKLTRIFLRVAFMTTEGENSYREYAADYVEFTEPFKLDTPVSITDRSVEIDEVGASIILNYTMQNGDNFSVTLTLPKGLELSTSENYAEYASTSGGEMPTVVAVKDGNLIGTLTLSKFGTYDKDALTQTDTAENTLPMQIFAPVALSNHAGFDNYKVCKSSATGANATAKYLWQDLTDYGGHTPDAPWLKSDCILAYDYGKIPFFINLNLADGSLGITEFENLAKSIVIAD